MSKLTSSKFIMLLVVLLVLVLATGCGAKAATVDTLPVYPGAVALKPGEDPVADTLAKNMEQDASLRAGIGVGGKIEQGAFRLPADASWEAVKAFYDEKLQANGWTSGMGGVGGNIASQALEAVNQSSDMVKMAMWSKGKQIFSIYRMLESPDSTQPYLIYSLNSN